MSGLVAGVCEVRRSGRYAFKAEERTGSIAAKHDAAARTAARPVPAAMIALDSVELTLPSAAGQVHILRGLDLIVERGETVSVVGPSGSGKSSMMMIIAGLERASSGRSEERRVGKECVRWFRSRWVRDH